MVNEKIADDEKNSAKDQYVNLMRDIKLNVEGMKSDISTLRAANEATIKRASCTEGGQKELENKLAASTAEYQGLNSSFNALSDKLISLEKMQIKNRGSDSITISANTEADDFYTYDFASFLCKPSNGLSSYSVSRMYNEWKQRFCLSSKDKGKAQVESFLQGAIQVAGNLDYFRSAQHKDMSLSLPDDIHAVGIAPSAGVLVPVPIYNDIIKQVYEQSPIDTVARKIPIIGGASGFKYPIQLRDVYRRRQSGELTSGDAPFTVLKFGEVTFNVSVIDTKIGITDQLVEASTTIGFLDFIKSTVALHFSIDKNYQYILGSGANSAKGIFTYDAWADKRIFEPYKLATAETIGIGDIEGNDLLNLFPLLQKSYFPNSQWLMNELTWVKITELKNSVGDYIFDPSELLLNGLGVKLMGRPVLLAPDVPEIAPNSIPIAFGDFSKSYMIYGDAPIAVKQYDNGYGEPVSFPSGYVLHFATRHDGRVVDFNGIKLLKVKSS